MKEKRKEVWKILALLLIIIGVPISSYWISTAFIKPAFPSGPLGECQQKACTIPNAYEVGYRTAQSIANISANNSTSGSITITTSISTTSYSTTSIPANI